MAYYKKKRPVLFVLFILSTVLFLLWGGIRTVEYIKFQRGCEGFLKRAADANTVELAVQETDKALKYIEAEGLTEGYTSVIYRTPDEDLGFWYTNIKSANNELKNLSPDATQLEKTNVLMKLRETLLDSGGQGKQEVTVPEGTSIYPYNKLFFFWGLVSFCWIWPWPVWYFAVYL